jgi:hypothetical protein
VIPAQNFAGDLAHAVQLLERDHVLMSRNLENAIGGGVDDRLAGRHVLRAEFVEDGGAGGGLVREGLAPDAPLPFAEDLRRKAVREGGERLVGDYPGHLPVPSDGILPLRLLLHNSVACRGLLTRRDPFYLHNISKAHLLKVGEVKSTQNAGGVCKSVTAAVAVLCGIRHGTRANTIKHYNY